MKSPTCEFVLLGFAALVGCSGGIEKPGEGPNFGVVSLKVQVALGNGLTLTAVDYTISGTSQYTGHLVAPAKSATISSRIGNIAPGNYNVTLTGYANEDAAITCSGTVANLAVQAGKAALASLSMACRGQSSEAGTGMVDIVATASMGPPGCPVFLNDSASALEIPADGTTSIKLSGASSSSLPAATLRWSAPTGFFAPATDSPVTYTCAPSTLTTELPVTLSISNGASECRRANDVIKLTCTGVAPTGCIVHVASSGADTNDGSTWPLALANVQAAFDVAARKVSAAICSSVDVWVAAGTYKPTYQTKSSDPRTATFQLAANVALYGGFSGTESTASARSVASNVTTLSGDIGSANDTSDNSYHVVTGVAGANIDGFTITAGNANGTDEAANGGGMFNNSVPTAGVGPTVTNCTFTGNSAGGGGGAMFNAYLSPTVTYCTFASNSGGWGGGMFNISSSPTVANCMFTSNSADSGGGMANTDNSSPTVTNCTFSGNDGYWGGGGILNIYSVTPTITNCTFVSNTSPDRGGGMSNNSGASPTVTNCTFSGNSAGYEGGAMYNQGSYAVVTNCAFAGNSAFDGGGITNEDWSYPTLRNCAFSGNSATHGGDWMYSYESWPTVTNCITSQDPLFVDAASGDLHLQPSSPAIDNGADCSSVVPSTDKDGNPRWDILAVSNASGTQGVDIGAYEFQGNDANGDAVIASCGRP